MASDTLGQSPMLYCKYAEARLRDEAQDAARQRGGATVPGKVGEEVKQLCLTLDGYGAWIYIALGLLDQSRY
jgi:hypothetical protein